MRTIMTTLSAALALILSAAASFAVTAAPPSPRVSPVIQPIPVSSCPSDVRRRNGPDTERSASQRRRSNCNTVVDDRYDDENRRRRPADCHRDVRTHRVGGVILRHRHVGDDCAIREVRRLNSF